MKKISTIIKEKNPYEINKLINNTAYVTSVTGKTGLLNIKNNELIGKLDDYLTFYDEKEQYYRQIKRIQNIECGKYESYDAITIYDVKKEKLIVNEWKIVRIMETNPDLFILESVLDRKVYIYDENNFKGLINNKFDKIDFLYNNFGRLLLTVTINDKKGIYEKSKGLVTQIEYDEIESYNDIIIYTKNGEKGFNYCDSDSKVNIEFDEINFDKKNKDIIYCKKEETIFVYNIRYHYLLLKIDCNSIKLETRTGDDFNGRFEEFFFAFKNDGKYGLIEVETNPVIRKDPDSKSKVNKLLPIEYDNINYDGLVFHLIKDEKIGLYKKESNIYIEPTFDKIKYLGKDIYALYKGEDCNIYKVSYPLELLVENCKIIDTFDEGVVFQKNNSFGLVVPHINRRNSALYENIILDDYDNVKYLGNGYFELQKDGKKGTCYRGLIIIPIEYDKIELYFDDKSLRNQTIYFSLGKIEEGFRLVKKNHDEYSDDKIEIFNDCIYNEIKFFEDIIVLKDNTYSYIYDYKSKLLKQLSFDADISMLDIKLNKINKNNIYCIDGIYYFYKNEIFEKVILEEYNLYKTTYESDYGSIVVSSYDKVEHDKVCEQIEEIDTVNSQQSLVSIYEDVLKKQEKNPVLIKMITPPEFDNK